jgi:hypothetical protein
MKGRIARVLVLGILCAISVQACSDQQFQDLELLNCKSLVPETENSFVHIGGGFFAYFNRRDGSAKETSALSSPCSNRLSDAQCSGEIRFSLNELGYKSRLVYLPEGSLVLKTAEGKTLNYNMQVLDYIQIPGRELPCYRLTASSNQENYSKAILVCCVVGTDSPVLVGTLYLVSASGISICSYTIEIRGRNNVEAEYHLWKVVEVASRF